MQMHTQLLINLQFLLLLKGCKLDNKLHTFIFLWIKQGTQLKQLTKQITMCTVRQQQHHCVVTKLTHEKISLTRTLFELL